MTQGFYTEILCRHRHTKARITRVTTPHGSFITPVFMPVATRAGVNNLTPEELLAVNSEIILGGNTYHMLRAPGMKVIEGAGGMHPFMGWRGPMLTDSGGFQIFSLSKNREICTIDEEGAHFKLPMSDEVIHMTPTSSLQTQKIIGADIIMAFDQCTPNEATEEEARAIMIRTHRWLDESVSFHLANPCTPYGLPQALFGIIQGGKHRSLREESTKYVTSMPLDGIAVGGETIGFDMPKTVEVIREIHPLLPEEKPRYAMGTGLSPQDLFDVVAEGIDMFDCVAPTRNARHGALYSGEIVPDGHWLRFESPYSHQRLSIKKAEFADDDTPIMRGCTCYTCQHFSRKDMHRLFKQKAPRFTALACIHNVAVMHLASSKMRECIMNERG